MAKKNTLGTILLLGALGIGGYLIYKSLTGSGSSVFGSGYSNGWIPGDTTPQTPANNDSNLPDDMTPDVAPKAPPLVTKIDENTGQQVITYSDTAPLTNKRILQGIGEIAVTNEIITQKTPVLRTTDIIKDLLGLPNVTPAPTVVPVPVPAVQKPILQPLPLQNFGVNITASPTVTLPIVAPTPTPVKVPVVSGTTNKQIIVSQAPKVSTPITTPVVRVTDVLKGLIAR